MGKQLLILAALLVLLAVPTLAQEGAQVEVRMDETEITPGEQVTVEIVVTNAGEIAGADIALAVDGTCLQVNGMTPGNYLPSAAENGGFAPVNTFDTTSARLAANVTDRQFIANEDGVFMTVQLDAACAQQSGTIEITRAELVTATGQQITAATAPLNIAIGTIADNAPASDSVQPPLTAPAATDGAGSNTDPLMLLAVGLLLFSGLGLASMVGWRAFRSTATG